MRIFFKYSVTSCAHHHAPSSHPAHPNLIPRVTRDKKVTEGSPLSTAKKFLPESLKGLPDTLVSGSLM